MKTFDTSERFGQNLENRTKTNVINSVFGASSNDEEGTVNQFLEIPLDLIATRPTNNFIQMNIDFLKESIKASHNRVIEPIVVVKISDLESDHPLLIDAKNKGMDLEGKKYILSAGERRLRAMKSLRDDYSSQNSSMPEMNPFVTITAKVLTAAEAKNEDVYYKDSNTKARSLTPLELFEQLDLFKQDVRTPEFEKAAMEEMYPPEVRQKLNSEGKRIRFSLYEYIRFKLEKEFGFTGWSKETIKKYYLLKMNSTPEYIQKIYNGEVTLKDALADTSKKRSAASKDIPVYIGKRASKTIGKASEKLIKIAEDLDKELESFLYEDKSTVKKAEKIILDTANKLKMLQNSSNFNKNS